MTQEHRISSTELSRTVGEVLNRVRYGGESFLIERNGKVVARLTPVQAPTTLRAALSGWLDAASSDPDLADVLEKIGDEDRPLVNPWP